jgi:hypothetical protein
MNERRLLVIGAGKRVREAALPSLAQCPGLRLHGIVARRAREEHGLTIGALSELNDLGDVDLIYMAVGKDAVPSVLQRLIDLGVSDKELLIDTPVVRFKNFRHAQKLKAFRRVSVAEDCAFLPWFDVVEAAVDKGMLGAPQALLLQQSAYAYHALATAKSLLGETRVRGGRRRRLGHRSFARQVNFAGGKRAHILEPRDYSIGRVTLLGTRGSLSDYRQDVKDDHWIETLVENDAVVGFRVDHIETRLTPEESSLTLGDGPDASLTARQEAMKRVGFLRIWRRLAVGEPAYALAEGLDDMVVDYHLEKVGRYLANPLTSSRSPVARVFLGALTRLGG